MVIAVNLTYKLNYERLIINSLPRSSHTVSVLQLWLPELKVVSQPVPDSVYAIIGTQGPLTFRGADKAQASVCQL